MRQDKIPTSVAGKDEPQAGGRPEGDAPLPAGARRWLLPATVTVSALLFIGLLAFGLRAQAPNGAIDDSLARGRAAPAPAFDLALLEPVDLGPGLGPKLGARLARERLSLEDLRGVPVVLNIWASWCDPCRQEAPLLERTWRTDGRRLGTVFLGLDQQDTTGDAGAFTHQYAISYPNVHDAGNDIPRSYGATGVPETYFIDARGQVVDHVLGITSPAQLREGMLAAQAGQPRGVRTGGARRPSR